MFVQVTAHVMDDDTVSFPLRAEPNQLPLPASKPKKDRCHSDPGTVTLGPLVIASGNTPKALEAVDQALHLIALLIDRRIEADVEPLIFPPGNGDPDDPGMQVLPDAGVALALVAHQPERADSCPGTSRPLKPQVFSSQSL